MIEPKQYKAITTIPKTDPFAGGQKREVIGYYVKHLGATPYPISTSQEHDDFVAKHTKHYIFRTSFSDWGLPTDLEQWEIDPDTLEEYEETKR